MKKHFFYAAVALVALASCADQEYIGDSPTPNPEKASDAIMFTSGTKGTTRADIYGSAAADLLGNNFYVTGTKGTEAATYPTDVLVFDNYLVHYGVNTAGTTASNTANWEYVGVQPAATVYTDYAYLTSMGRTTDKQTIKYWDYSVPQYHFMAFSTGTHKAVTTTPSSGQIGVTAMNYGSALAGEGIAYTFTLPDVNALKQAYITDIVEVNRDVEGYGKEVQLKFKSLGAKVRVAFYETVPGYSVKDVVFYNEDGTGITGGKTTAVEGAALISADANGIPKNGQIKVYFPHVGTNYQPGGTTPKTDYNKAAATIVLPDAGTENYDKAPTFGALTEQLVARENKEVKWQDDPDGDGPLTAGWVAEGSVFLGRSLPQASFAGNEDEKFYKAIFPVNAPSALTLRVDYTLVPIDGAGENIIVKGAKAVVPSTYTKWLPNYAYTYVFKISDNTNGWTGAVDKPSGLFPITFDAVVAEVTDATGEQTTITTVATPTITTYQQGHVYSGDPLTSPDEYSKAIGKNIYVQVMDNTTVPAKLVGAEGSEMPLLNTNAKEGTAASRLFAVTAEEGVVISEATVMDALHNRTTALNADDVVGRNKITLTKNANIDNTVTSIVNGADDNPISVTGGQAAEIDISIAAGTYAYVYDYTGASTTKSQTTIYQPIATTSSTVIATTEKYVTTAILDAIDTSVAGNVTTTDEAVSQSFIYFSKTENGEGTTTYSFVSVDDKTNLPAGLVKCPVGSLVDGDGSKTVETAEAAFVFTIYTRNNGKYAVKIIKIVA